VPEVRGVPKGRETRVVLEHARWLRGPARHGEVVADFNDGEELALPELVLVVEVLLFVFRVDRAVIWTPPRAGPAPLNATSL
jgi:hypothetical protein